MQRLIEKVAVVTGGSSGIGLAVARQMIEEGAAQVYITGRREKELNEAAALLGPNASGVQGDISKRDDLSRLFGKIKTDGRRIDIVFANAAVGVATQIGSIDEAAFDHIIAVNLKGTVFTIEDALPLMNDGGSIIITGSSSSTKGYDLLLAYAATKAALRSVVRTAAVTLARRNIRVNMLTPGTTDTPSFALIPKELREDFIAQAPLARIAEPDEIARAALFLASSDSSYVTGIDLTVDGGTTQV
jgi:NAD(P)-dependent dehydrogenase (short-subunit alcohol dehydrogenase family)